MVKIVYNRKILHSGAKGLVWPVWSGLKPPENPIGFNRLVQRIMPKAYKGWQGAWLHHRKPYYHWEADGDVFDYVTILPISRSKKRFALDFVETAGHSLAIPGWLFSGGARALASRIIELDHFVPDVFVFGQPQDSPYRGIDVPLPLSVPSSDVAADTPF